MKSWKIKIEIHKVKAARKLTEIIIKQLNYFTFYIKNNDILIV